MGNTTSTDSGTYIPNGYGKGYPPKMFTDPKYAAAQTDTDNDSETNPLHIQFLGDYCQTCISKWSRCTCKPPSDWDADPIDITQPDSPANNDKGDRHPYLQIGVTRKFFGMRRHDKTRPSSLKPVQMPPPKRDSEEFDWNENLYPHQYHAKVQSQVPARYPPPD